MTTTSYKRVFALAIPASLAALITPLLGLVDSAVLGLSPRPLDIGAVGLAGSIYSLLYWTFGFLRMSAAGLTAQAHGADDKQLIRRILGQSVIFGFAVGLALVALQAPIGEALFWVFTRDSDLSLETEAAARSYFFIRIWSAPFAIATFGLFGWMTARGATGLLLAVTAGMTLLNAGLDALFVLKFGLGAAGVAIGTVIAEALGFVAALGGVAFLLHKEGSIKNFWPALTEFWRPRAYRALIAVNGDIFLRSILLSIAFAYFVQRGSLFGDVTLAANQVLMQLVLVTGLALDGAAIAAETLVGQAIGQKEKQKRLALYRVAVRRTSIVAGAGALGFTLLFWLAGPPLVTLIARDPEISTHAMTFMPWAIISPLIVVTCFQLDGIFIGATKFRAMRNSMFLSALVFAITSVSFIHLWGNHGLWLSFWLFMLARAVTLGMQLPNIGKGLTKTVKG